MNFVAGEPGERDQLFPSGEPNLSVTAVRYGAAQVPQVKGEVDATSAWRIDDAVMGVLPAQVSRGPIIVDLSDVEFFSAAGITALVTAKKLCDGLTDLRIVAASQPVMRLLEVAALSGELTVHPTPRPGSRRLLITPAELRCVERAFLAGLVMRLAEGTGMLGLG